MFSGKSEELIRLIRRANYARQPLAIIKPGNDSRQDNIRSRELSASGQSVIASEIPAYSASDPYAFRQLLARLQPELLFIDEAQFFDDWLIIELENLLKQGKQDIKIVVCGLDKDAWAKPFGPMAELMVMADEVVKLTAICFQCCQPAQMTYKYSAGTGTIEPGDIDKYEARCRQCWSEPA